MLQKGSLLTVIDNSGAKLVKCIHVYDVKNFAIGVAGRRILVSVRKYLSSKGVSKGSKWQGVIAKVAKPTTRPGGECIFFSTNAVVLLKNFDTPLGSRILGPVMLELRLSGHVRIVSLSLFTM